MAEGLATGGLEEFEELKRREYDEVVIARLFLIFPSARAVRANGLVSRQQAAAAGNATVPSAHHGALSNHGWRPLAVF